MKASPSSSPGKEKIAVYLELDRLSKQFDGKYAVHDLSLGLEEGGPGTV